MKCPYCNVKMKKIRDLFGPEQIEYDLNKCPKCEERYLSMDQLHELGEKHKAWRRANRVTFSKWGNSIGVRIPKELAVELKIKVGSSGIAKREKNGLFIMPS